jgi:8-oxo-dGTP diphosphatase
MEETQLYIVAVAAIIICDGKVLAMRRSKTKDAGAGLWETLSGRVSLGEEPLDAIRREITEECGLEVDVESSPFTAYQARRNDIPMMVLVYKAYYKQGEVVISEEHDDYAWLSPDEFSQRSSLKKLVETVYQAVI